jgi:sulfide:quinone oxidoreductase
MAERVVILGAGFGGLELSSRLSEAFGEGIDVTLIDKNDGFVFGFSKFELVFDGKAIEDIKSYYRDIVKPGVTFRQENITSIDPARRRVVTDAGAYDADVLVIALGLDYDIDATPGLREGGYEFYSVPGAARLGEALPAFTSGRVIIAVLGEPYKCPPAPCEAALLLDEYLAKRGVRGDAEITVVHPWARPVPPSPDASKAILEAFDERGITFMAQKLVTAIDPTTKVAQLKDGSTLPYDLFLGVPIHRVPAVVAESGMAEGVAIPVDKTTLATKFADVYAIGDINNAPVPRAGVFAESAARTVGDEIIARIRGGDVRPYDGAGSCYVEFGGHKVGRIDADFLTGPTVTAPFTPPSAEGAAQKAEFASSRRKRWFRG